MDRRTILKDEPCIRCGHNTETCCLRHYNGLRQLAFGKGRGIKCSDVAAAWLCSDCDSLYSEGVTFSVCPLSESLNSIVNVENTEFYRELVAVERSEKFLVLCVKTGIAIDKKSEKQKKYKKPSKVVARNPNGFH